MPSGFVNLGSKTVLAGGYQIRNGVRVFSGSGFPTSGTSGTGIDAISGQGAPTGSIYVDKATGVEFVNEGSVTSPYWTPVSFRQARLTAWYDDFSSGYGKALTDTATSYTMPSGVRVSGQGIDETDSGFAITMSEAGAVGALTTTDEDEHTACLSVGPLAGTVALMQPDLQTLCVVDANISNSVALTARRIFLGFSGNATLALDPLATGATTVISFAATISDDICGIFMDANLTDADGWFTIYDKGNTNASISTTATGVDASQTVAAVGTYQRLRVEVDADGGARTFIDKVLIATLPAGTLDTDEEIQPVLQLSADGAAVKVLNVKHFGAWGKRAA